MDKIKTPSRTAQALALVQSGVPVGKAAKEFGIRPQSVYRLIKYRAAKPACSVCGK